MLQSEEEQLKHRSALFSAYYPTISFIIKAPTNFIQSQHAVCKHLSVTDHLGDISPTLINVTDLPTKVPLHPLFLEYHGNYGKPVCRQPPP